MTDTVRSDQEQTGPGSEGSGLMTRILQLEAGLSSLKDLVYKMDSAVRVNKTTIVHVKGDQDKMAEEVERLRACVDAADRQMTDLKKFVDDQKRVTEDARAFWKKIWNDTVSAIIKTVVFALLGLLLAGGLYKLSDALKEVK